MENAGTGTRPRFAQCPSLLPITHPPSCTLYYGSALRIKRSAVHSLTWHSVSSSIPPSFVMLVFRNVGLILYVRECIMGNAGTRAPRLRFAQCPSLLLLLPIMHPSLSRALPLLRHCHCHCLNIITWQRKWLSSPWPVSRLNSAAGAEQVRNATQRSAGGSWLAGRQGGLAIRNT